MPAVVILAAPALFAAQRECSLTPHHIDEYSLGLALDQACPPPSSGISDLRAMLVKDMEMPVSGVKQHHRKSLSFYSLKCHLFCSQADIT